MVRFSLTLVPLPLNALATKQNGVERNLIRSFPTLLR